MTISNEVLMKTFQMLMERLDRLEQKVEEQAQLQQVRYCNLSAIMVENREKLRYTTGLIENNVLERVCDIESVVESINEDQVDGQWLIAKVNRIEKMIEK